MVQQILSTPTFCKVDENSHLPQYLVYDHCFVMSHETLKNKLKGTYQNSMFSEWGPLIYTLLQGFICHENMRALTSFLLKSEKVEYTYLQYVYCFWSY